MTAVYLVSAELCSGLLGMYLFDKPKFEIFIFNN